MKKCFLKVITLSVLGLAVFIGLSSVNASAKNLPEDTSGRVLKLRVKRPIRVQQVKLEDITANNKNAGIKMVPKGSIIYTWYAGAGGFAHPMVSKKLHSSKYGYDLYLWTKPHTKSLNMRNYKVLHRYKSGVRIPYQQ